jgi:hypothetical protein
MNDLLPRFFRLTQFFNVPALADPAQATRAALGELPAASMEQEEMKLLEEARRLMPRLPFEEVDLLIVDEMGKNLSGSGLDTNVIRRDTQGSFILPGPKPVRRIYVRGLHPDSYGNAAGIGLADFVHDRLRAAVDWEATSANVIASLIPANARVPLHFPTDRQALAVALQTSGRQEPREARVLWIKNTLSCQTVLASEAYLQEARARHDLRIEGEPDRLALDSQGNQAPVF